MKDGNWVPISKAALIALPVDRPYTELEALYSMQVDYDNNRDVSIAGYSKLWGWSRTKVSSFIQRIGSSIQYPNDTRKRQNQKGQIKKQIKSRSALEKKQIKFTDSKTFNELKNRYPEKKKQIKYRSESTTKEPLYPNPKAIKAQRPSKEQIDHGSDLLIDEHIKNLSQQLYEEKKFPKVISFVNAMIKQGKNKRAILHCLNRVLEEEVKSPWAYCVKILSIEDYNFNAQDYIKSGKSETIKSNRCGLCYQFKNENGCWDKVVDDPVCRDFAFDANAPGRWVQTHGGKSCSK